MAPGLAAGVYAALGTFTVSQPNFLTAVLGILEVVGYQLGPAQFAGQIRGAGGVDEKYVRCLLPRHFLGLIPLCTDEK